MLVIEDWDAAAGFFKDIHNLLKPVIARIELLPHFVVRVIAMLCYDYDAIHRETACAKGKGICNRCGISVAILRKALLPNIILRELGNIHGCDINARILPGTIPVIAKM